MKFIPVADQTPSENQGTSYTYIDGKLLKRSGGNGIQTHHGFKLETTISK